MPETDDEFGPVLPPRELAELRRSMDGSGTWGERGADHVITALLDHADAVAAELRRTQEERDALRRLVAALDQQIEDMLTHMVPAPDASREAETPKKERPRKNDPFSIGCPRCKQPSPQLCRNSHGDVLGHPHVERAELAEQNDQD